ncbi:MAG: hypothetical protein Kow0029_21070 [Candidatus Rifleibacteriota bacterium]
MTQLERAEKSSTSGIYFKVFLTVFILVLLTVIAAFWAINSNSFVNFAFRFLVNKAEYNSFKVDFPGISGSLKDGIKISQLKIRNTAPVFSADIEKLSIEFNFSDIFSKKGLYCDVKCEKAKIVGNLFFKWFNELPPFPEAGCFVKLPGNIFISSVNITELELKPSKEQDCHLLFSPLQLNAPDTDGVQAFTTDFSGLIKARKLFSGSFSGKLNQRKRRLEGRVDSCLCGEKLITEVSLAAKHGKLEAGGHIIEGCLNIAIISRWLVSLWQDGFPFGFDGKIKVGGSWVYGSETGFIGNLNGSFEKIRMVALGLFITIFELNGNWKFFDGNLEVTDSGSFFAGFPAVLSGGVDSVASPNRKWNLSFKADTISMEQFYNDLPWGIRYGAGIPKIAGNAMFSLQVRGNFPEVVALLKTDRIFIEKGADSHRISGDITYKYGKGEPGIWKANISCDAIKGVVGMLNRFVSLNAKLGEVMEKGRIERIAWEGIGTSLSDMNVKGKISDFMGDLEFAGCFKDGTGHFHTLPDTQKRFPETYKIGQISFLEFLLAY